MQKTIQVQGEVQAVEELAFALRGEADFDSMTITFDDSVVEGDVSQVTFIAPIYGVTLGFMKNMDEETFAIFESSGQDISLDPTPFD